MKYKLSDIADITMGQSPKSEFYNSEGNGLPFLQGNRTFGDRYPTFDTWTTSPTKIAEAGDVIMSVRAPVGDLNITPVKMCLGRGVCSIRAKNGCQDFIYYLMQFSVKQLLSKESGTVFGSVNRNDINGLEVDIPEKIEKQEKIAKFLSLIDEKIEINKRINQNLLQQIQFLCRSWLVDYAPFGYEQPATWSVVPLSSIADFVSGYSYKGAELVESDIAMATIKNFDRKGGFKLDGYKEIQPSAKIKPEQHAQLFDTLVAHTDLTQNAEVIGNAEPILSMSGYKDIVFSMDVVKVLPKEGVSRFLLAALLQDGRFKTHALGYVNGTTVLHLSKKALPEFELPLPSDLEDLRPLTDAIETMYRQIASNIDESTQLANLRDSLLPQLMSGELDVSDIDF